MKLFSVIAIIALCFLNSVNAQDTIQKNKIYRTWITVNSELLKPKGVLYEIKDSSILVSNSVLIQDYYSERFDTFKLHFNDIETVKIRKKNSIGNGILIGAFTGIAIGGLIGLMSEDDPPCSQGSWICFRFTAGEKALLAGIPFSIGGACVPPDACRGPFRCATPVPGLQRV